jgi:lipopolysaccharide transport system permease protein
MAENQKTGKWVEVIEPKAAMLDFKLKEIWRYRNLLQMLVIRDIVSVYRQTVLGPIWFMVQPIMTTVVYTIIFGRFAGLSSDGQPRLLFYLSGIIIWNYFSECFLKTSTVLKTNQSMFKKIYFPRLIMPLSIIASTFFRFLIQYLMFIIFLVNDIMSGDSSVKPNAYMLLTPVLLVIMAGISLGVGMLFSALTIRYRDLVFIVNFGVSLLMFATPIIYPISSIPEQYKIYAELNPLTPIVECFRYAYLGSGTFSPASLGYSVLSMFGLLFIGLIVFNRIQRTFIDFI